MRSERRFIVASATLVLSIGALSAFAAETAPAHSIVERWKVGGTGSWDFLTLDAPSHRLFITRGERVDVLDTRTGSIVGHIPDTHGVHGVALAHDLKRGYTSNGKANTITEFDLETLAVLRTVPVKGDDPDPIFYLPSSQQVLAFNSHSHNINVFDAKSLKLVATVKVPGPPEFGVDDGAGHVFVNMESEPGELVRIDTKSLKVTATWKLPGCDSPTGLALDATHQHLFSVCDHNVMAVTDARTGHQVAQIPIGLGPDAAAFDPERGLTFISSRDGTLTIVGREPDGRYVVRQSLTTMVGAKTMAYDQETGRVYLESAEFGATPDATPENPKPRPEQKPGSFTVLVVAPR